jgi:hypothetical protein
MGPDSYSKIGTVGYSQPSGTLFSAAGDYQAQEPPLDWLEFNNATENHASFTLRSY